MSRFSRFQSTFSIAIAILVGIVIGSGLTFAMITMLWGRPDLWPLRAG